MFSLRLQGGIPLSEQLEARIAELIIGGEMAENESCLLCVRSQRRLLSIRTRCRKPTDSLNREGLYIRFPERGSYVAERSQYSSAVLEKATEEFRKAVEDGVKSGLTGGDDEGGN